MQYEWLAYGKCTIIIIMVAVPLSLHYSVLFCKVNVLLTQWTFNYCSLLEQSLNLNLHRFINGEICRALETAISQTKQSSSQPTHSHTTFTPGQVCFPSSNHLQECGIWTGWALDSYINSSIIISFCCPMQCYCGWNVDRHNAVLLSQT